MDGGAWITAEYPDLGKIRTDRILSGCGSSPEYYLVYLGEHGDMQIKKVMSVMK